MNNLFRFSTLLFFLVFGQVISYSQQKAEWKGKVVIEEGVRIVQNPAQPLYGEIHFKLEEDLSIGNEEDENYLFYKTWHMAVDKHGNIYVVDGGNSRIQVFDSEGQYLRTIGRRGQGPGEFMSPTGVFINDIGEEIYVPDMRSIKVFALSGDYLRTITLKSFMRSFCISSSGIILCTTSLRHEKEYVVTLNFIDDTGKSEPARATYLDQISKIIEGQVAKFSHGYEYMLYTTSISPKTFVYGYSKDYELNIIDSTGKLLFKIQKESSTLPISKEEKEAVKEQFRDSPIKNLNNIPFPKHKPHFGRILTDGDLIFVMHFRSPQDQNKVWTMYIFDNRGYYLYEGIFPVQPKIIKNGFVYLIESSDETGNIRVKRYKIINWEQINIEE